MNTIKTAANDTIGERFESFADSASQHNRPQMSLHLRVARPVSDITKTADMYCNGLNLKIVGSFKDHEGFDGIILGFSGSDYHFEFTHSKQHPITPQSTVEDLFVFYIPDLETWNSIVSNMKAAGFEEIEPFNPYWSIKGCTLKDRDGYRVVLQNAEWNNLASDQGGFEVRLMGDRYDI
jgi:hypothetical protein